MSQQYSSQRLASSNSLELKETGRLCWLLKEENLKGVWGNVDFYKGDEFEVELITITVNREGRENLCRIEYDGEDLFPMDLNGGGVTEEIRPY